MSTWWHTIIEPWMQRHARTALSAGLLFGLVWDALTIQRADELFENITIVGYLLLTAITIVLLALYGRRYSEEKLLFPLLVLQFAFGNLASALLVLFVKSGTIAGGILFLVPLGTLLIANELLHKRYMRTHVHVVIWYFFVLTYAIFAVPVFLQVLGDASVIAGVVTALAAVAVLLLVLYTITRERVLQEVPRIAATVAVVTLLFGVLYQFNAIPPVPLSATAIGVYHNVERTAEGDYRVIYESPRWYAFWWRDTAREFSYVPGEKVHCFSSVYAPAGISAPVYHRFETKAENDTWRTVSYVPFVISGGRTDGYRGYTLTSQVVPGKWRCSVETERGALIARFNFDVVSVDALPTLFESTL